MNEFKRQDFVEEDAFDTEPDCEMNELQWQGFVEEDVSDIEPDCETMIMKMNGVHYVVNNYFDGEDTLKKRFGAMIENSFESTNVPKDANDTLSSSDIAFQMM